MIHSCSQIIVFYHWRSNIVLRWRGDNERGKDLGCYPFKYQNVFENHNVTTAPKPRRRNQHTQTGDGQNQ